MVKGRTRVLFVSDVYGGGGAERVLETLLLHIDRTKFDVALVVFRDKIEYLVPEGTQFFCLHRKNWRDYPTVIWNLSLLYRNWKPNVVLSFLRFPNIITVIAKAISHTQFKLLLSEHGIPSFALSNHKGLISILSNKWLPTWLYKFSDGVICVSQTLSDEVHRIYRIPYEKIILIYNPIDIGMISIFAKENVEHSWFNGKIPIIIAVGRLTQIKGYAYLLKAFKLVQEKKSSRLVILGKGEQEKPLKQLAADLNIEKEVAFLGFQTNPFKYLSHSTLFVLSSLSEAFPMVVLEAMSCGIPVISTNCPGPNEMISNDVNGILVPKADEKSLAEAITRLLNNKSIADKLSEEGKKRVSEFSVKTIIKKYEKIFVS